MNPPAPRAACAALVGLLLLGATAAADGTETVPPPRPKASPDLPAGSAPRAAAELPPPANVRAAGADPAAKEGGKKGSGKETTAADGRCDECGSCRCVAKVCVPKMTEKEITKVCWDSKCEDFCIPGPSVRCGTTCGSDECGCWSHAVWKPTCARVATRVVPVKKTTKRKVPSVEWKVVERCACCRAKAPCGVGDPSAAAKDGARQDDAAETPGPDAGGEAAKKPASRPSAARIAWPWDGWLR